MPLIGNKVVEKDLRDFLQESGYYGRSAEFARIELAALQRPGWLQVFVFEVRAKEQDGDWVELFGCCRDDERSKQFDVVVTQDEAHRDERLSEFSEGLITLRRGQRTSVHFGLIAFCVVALAIAGFAAANNLLFGRTITDETLSSPGQWSQWGAFERNFHLPGYDLSRDWNDSILKPVWSLDLNPGCGYAGVAVKDGVVFTMYRDDTVEVSIGVDGRTGRRIWEQRDEVPYVNLDYGMGPYSTPLVHDRSAFFLGATGILTARNVDDGETLWRRDLETEFPGARKTRGYATSPLFVDDKLILLQGAPDAAVIALDPVDGSTVWQQHGFSAEYASAITVLVDGQPQLVCQMEKEVIGLELSGGNLLWKHDCPSENTRQATTPVDLGDGTIVIGTGSGVERLKLGSANVESLWKSRKIKTQIGNLLHVKQPDILLGANGTRPGSPLVALDVETGELLWRTRELDCGFLWLAGNDLFNLPPDGNLKLALVDREGPTIVAKARPFKGPQIYSAPAMIGPVLYVKDAEKLVALNLASDLEP